jgi:ankyrin repeat protein
MAEVQEVRLYPCDLKGFLNYLHKGETSLLTACEEGHVEVVTVLLEAGETNIEAQDAVSPRLIDESV